MGVRLRRDPCGGEDLSPGALSLGRLAVGSAILGVFVLAQRRELPGRRELPLLLVCGVLWFGLYNLTLNEAEQRIDAGTASIGFLTWAYALSRTTAGRMGATTYLVPPIAILIGWALLAESPEHWRSSAACFASEAS